MDRIKNAVKKDCENVTHCSLHILALIPHELITSFSSTKFRLSKKHFVNYIFYKDKHREIVITEHNRAHRAAQENTNFTRLLFAKND